jgi:hypothetical protein
MIGENAVRFSPPVYFLHFTPQVLSFLFHYMFLVLFLFLTVINLLIFCFFEIYIYIYIYILLLVLLTGVLVLKFGGHLGLFHTLTFPSGNVFLYYTLKENVQFKFGGMEKYFVYLFLFLFVYFCLSFCAKKN